MRNEALEAMVKIIHEGARQGYLMKQCVRRIIVVTTASFTNRTYELLSNGNRQRQSKSSHSNISAWQAIQGDQTKNDHIHYDMA